MWPEDFPKSESFEFRLAWLQDERQKGLTLLGHSLAHPGRGTQAESCFKRLDRIEMQEASITRLTALPKQSAG